jgi:hypothetical protein
LVLDLRSSFARFDLKHLCNENKVRGCLSCSARAVVWIRSGHNLD